MVKRTLVDEHGGACRLCGYGTCIDALEFHHVDPSTKSFAMAMSSGRSLAAYREESQKCLLLCGNCHRLVEEHSRGPRSRWQVRRRRLREEVVAWAGGRCLIEACGYDACIPALVFHHLDRGSKDHVLTTAQMRSLDEAIVEARKCVLLCVNCHAEVEAGLVAAPGAGRLPGRVRVGRPAWMPTPASSGSA